MAFGIRCIIRFLFHVQLFSSTLFIWKWSARKITAACSMILVLFIFSCWNVVSNTLVLLIWSLIPIDVVVLTGKRKRASSVTSGICNGYFHTVELNYSVGGLDNQKFLLTTFAVSSTSEIFKIYFMELHHHFCNQTTTMALFCPSLQ